MTTVGNRNTNNVQSKVDKLLARAGLQASPFDPLSLKALQEYLADKEDNDDPTTVLEQLDIYSPTSNSRSKSSNNMDSDDFLITSTAPTPSASFPREDRLMEQIQLQTSLILDLQRKIDNLTGRVKELENTGAASRRFLSYNKADEEEEESDNHVAVGAPPVARRAAMPRVAAEQDDVVIPPQPQQQHQQEQQEHEEPPPEQPRMAAAPPANRESRVARLLRIFGQMRRQQVPNLEWGLVFKVAIIMAILFSRLGASANEMPLKFLILGAVLVGGVLLQTGYAQFLYNFFVQENYMYRILFLNEDVAVPPPGPPRPRAAQQQQQQQGADDGWFDWRETFLGGRIQRGDQAPPAPLLWRFCREVVLLVSSFVLSIFPMWHLEAPPPPPPAAQDNNEENDDTQPLIPQNNNAAGGPGLVRPPADPAEPEEDDDEGESDVDDIED